MDENEIAARLKQNLPQPPPAVIPTAPDPLTDEQSSIDSGANELHLLKLSNFLGIPYSQEHFEKLKFIYDQGLALAGQSDYDTILASVNDLLVRLGFSYREDRFMKLWLWLRLNQERMAIETELLRVQNG